MSCHPLTNSVAKDDQSISIRKPETETLGNIDEQVIRPRMGFAIFDRLNCITRYERFAAYGCLRLIYPRHLLFR